MNSLKDSAAIFSYHRQMAETYGAKSSLALGWLNYSDQQIRFEVLSQIAELNNKTVLDAGCGYGDFYKYLSDKHLLKHYYGVEQIPEMVKEAEIRYQNTNNTTFISRSFLSGSLPLADYVFASGSLNYGSVDPGFIFKAIERLFDCCRFGLAFNLLHTLPTNGLLVAYNKDLILTHCNMLSNKVEIKDQYNDEDFTVFIYRT